MSDVARSRLSCSRGLPFFALVIAGILAVPHSASGQLHSTSIPRFDAAVSRAVTFLQDARLAEREKSLVAYALFKAGVPITDPVVADGLHEAENRSRDARNYGSVGYDHLYLAGVDAMLLADLNPDQYFSNLQNIAAYVAAVQRPDGSWSDTPENPGDTSMCQYALLALWAAQRAGCDVSLKVVDRAAKWHLGSGNPDSGWGYRPGTNKGDGNGASTYTMTMAGAGSLSITRLLLHGQWERKREKSNTELKFGVLEKIDPADDLRQAQTQGAAAPVAGDYRPEVSVSAIHERVERAFQWNQVRFKPICPALNKIYFYYALERAAALHQVDSVDGQPLYVTYGDGLLTYQAENGSFPTFTGANIGTSFAILFYMKSTQQILKGIGAGGQQGNRDLLKFMNPEGREKKEIGPLDELLASLEGQDFASLDVDALDVVERIRFGSPEELIGQVDNLKKLLKDPDPEKRRVAYWALGRTGDFSMVQLMLEGLRDPNVGVNADALEALRFISRKPRGFGISSDPLAGLEEGASDERRVEVANAWRTQAYKTWGAWYSSVRPYSERDGLDELLRSLP